MRTRVPETADPEASRPFSSPAGRPGDMSRRPRILLLITLGEVGGAQGYVASLLPALAEQFDVAVATHGDGFLQQAAARSGARFLPLRHVRRPIRPWRDLAGFVELIRLLRRERPDILHASSSKAGILGRFAAVAARVPIRIFTAHGWAFAAHQGLVSVLYRWADRAAARVTTTTICVSENERVQGVRARTCRAERTVVIRNAVDAAAAPHARHDHATPRLVAVGRLKRPKDFLTLVRALAALGPGSFAEALIVGDGPDRAAIEREISRLGLEDRVRLAGERSDVPELLAAADVFVLSSASEGLPLSVMEAMAAGLPVVASAVGGIPELVIDGETGLLVPAGDATELTAALERVLLDRQLRRRLGAAGRARAENAFDIASFRSAHLEVYRRELARAGAPAP
jgi:glycosyltransferase involved in cell wall biosynthesis